jgi:excisionase family DNA binding protein
MTQRTPMAPRITLTVDEAAAALGISRDHLERHILGDLRVIYVGRRRLIPIRELERWADQHAVRHHSKALDTTTRKEGSHER